MVDSSFETDNAPRRSSRISAQARPEVPAKRSRKGAPAADGSAKATKAGTRKRALKEDQEEDQVANIEREQDAKKVCCVLNVCFNSALMSFFLSYFSRKQYSFDRSMFGIGKAFC